MAEPLLRIASLSAGYGDVQVLWDIDLQVPRGEISCLIGSNGAGKTTLLRAISGLIETRSGSIAVGGAPLAGADAQAVLSAGIAHVPEGRRLFAAMSVRDNLLMGAYLRRDGKSAIEQDLEKAYAMFPILRQRHAQDAGTLSGGEQQMCAIARGLMSRPRLLLIDELCDVLRALNREGVTMLVVEQDVATALDLASTAFVMDTGRVTRSGPSASLRDDPAIHEAYLGTI